MKIAVYHGLPLGGAKRSIEAIEAGLRKHHQVTTFDATRHLIKRTNNRLIIDLNALVWQRFYQKRLAREIDAGKFDVCFVTHDPYLQCPWLLRYLKTPSVFLCQEPTRSYYEYFLRVPDLPMPNYLYETINRWIRKIYERENANAATITVANSLFSVESLFRSYGIIAKNIYLGVNPKEYYPEKVAKRNQILIVGNDEPQKALNFAIEIVGKIESKIRPKLVVVSPRMYDENTIINLAGKSKVKLKIWHSLTVNQIRRLYSQSLMTLAVSYLEPFGLSSVESMACATPVVAVNEGGFRESVKQGITGVLLERDSTVIAQEITKLLKSPKKLKKLGANGPAHVKRHFTWSQTIARLEPALQYASRHRHS